MKLSSFLVFSVVAVFGVACERHSADSLPSHGGAGHGNGHAGGGDKGGAHAAPAKAASSGHAAPKVEDKKAPAAAGEAPKFFEGKKAEDPKGTK